VSGDELTLPRRVRPQPTPNLNAGGPLGRGPDHWVLICGARLRGPGDDRPGRVYQEVLVSDSARSTAGESWVDAHDLLRDRGGFNLLLARPR
jgi:hypothetical protein